MHKDDEVLGDSIEDISIKMRETFYRMKKLVEDRGKALEAIHIIAEDCVYHDCCEHHACDSGFRNIINEIDKVMKL
jgi:hypothetical protein